MKAIVSTIILIVSLLLAPATSVAAAPVEGRWRTEDANGIVAIEVRDGVLTGTLVESTHDNAKTGSVILREFVRDGDGWKGKIKAPKRGKVVDARLAVVGDTLVIEVTAGRRTKTVRWTRSRS